MKCPRCKLENPDTAERCDCGYDFASRTVKASYVDLAREDKDGPSEPPEVVRERGRNDVITGIAIFGVGLLISGATYAVAVSRGGGMYVLATGAMFGGLVRVLRGIDRQRTGRDTPPFWRR
jgi:hypothetical protein